MRSDYTVDEGTDGERGLFTSPGISGKETRTQSAVTFSVYHEVTEVETTQSGVSQIKAIVKLLFITNGLPASRTHDDHQRTKERD
jgi:hypothetical protein